jgi:hypothetical protein
LNDLSVPALTTTFKWQQVPAVAAMSSDLLSCILINKMYSLVKAGQQENTWLPSVGDKMKYYQNLSPS